jgi:hypothetical protein
VQEKGLSAGLHDDSLSRGTSSAQGVKRAGPMWRDRPVENLPVSFVTVFETMIAVLFNACQSLQGVTAWLECIMFTLTLTANTRSIS